MNRPVIIYDGACRFCTWSMRRIRKLDRDNRFDLIPRQQPGLETRFPRLGESDFNTGLRLIHADGHVDIGADGVYEIYRRLPPYHLITWVYRLPILRQIFRLGYAFIARYRHHLGRIDPGLVCTSDACQCVK